MSQPGKPLILVVEDEHLVRELMLITLSEAGFDTLDTASGLDAIRLLRERDGDIRGLVTDVNLGRPPNGWEVAIFAREQRKDLAVLYLTGDSAGQWRNRGVAGSRLIEKPFSPHEAAQAMLTLLKREKPDEPQGRAKT